MENRQLEEAGQAHGCLRCYQWVLPRSTPRVEIPLQEMAPPAEQAAQQAADEQQAVEPVAAENPQPRIGPQQPIYHAEAANMENGQPEEAGHAHGCLRCYRWVLPRATPREDIPLQEVPPPAERAAQQAADEQKEVAPVAAENPQPRIGPQQPINQAEAANVENPRQPEEAESAHEDLCCCACFFPPSIPGEEIPQQAVDGQQEVVPVAAVSLQPMSGSQQPLKQEDKVTEEDIESGCTECPRENYRFYVVFTFILLYLLCAGQTLNILSYELGWRGNGAENASIQTNNNATTETNMIFDITTAIRM